MEDTSILKSVLWPLVNRFVAIGAVTGLAGSLIVQGLALVVPGGEHLAGFVTLVMWKLMIFPGYTLARFTGWEWGIGGTHSLDVIMFVIICVINTLLCAAMGAVAGLFCQSIVKIKREWNSANGKSQQGFSRLLLIGNVQGL